MSFASSMGSRGRKESTPAVSTAESQDDLEDMQTEHFGFASIAARDAKTKITNQLRLLPTPWPFDKLPPAGANLLTTAPRKGLVAAAGPHCLVIARADCIREALNLPRDESNKNPVVDFSPDLIIHTQLLSHLAFTSDEEYLVRSDQQAGVLAIHEVAALYQKNTNPAFEMPTDGNGILAMVPNPDPEKALVAIIVKNAADSKYGKIMIANLKERNFVQTSQGAVLLEDATCVAWSNQGKQLVAGLPNGTAVQMKPDGSVQARIPRPPDVIDEPLVRAILWLGNDEFIIIYELNSKSNPTQNDSPSEMIFFSVSRAKGTSDFKFKQFTMPACDGFGSIRNNPPHYFTCRLRNWQPRLHELVLIASTGGTDLGVLTKMSDANSKKPEFCVPTSIAADDRKASFPGTVDHEAYPDMPDFSPLGLALDLSSKDRVYKPISGNDIESSKTPLPAVMMLSHEGFLNAWWIVHDASVEEGTAYGGLAPTNDQSPPVNNQSQSAGPVAPVFGTSTFGNVFGSASNPGAPAQHATGATFGSTGGLGQMASPWAVPTSEPSNTSKLGGIFGGPATSQSGFAKFGNEPTGFAATAANTGPQSTFRGIGATNNGKSVFGSGFPFSGGAPSFGPSTQNSTSIFGQQKPAEQPQTRDSDMGDAEPKGGDSSSKIPPGTGLFGMRESDFKLGSTFVGDASAQDDLPKHQTGSSSGAFGLESALGSALSEVQKTEKSVSSSFAGDAEAFISPKNAQKSGGGSAPAIMPISAATSGFFSQPDTRPASDTKVGITPKATSLPHDFVKESSEDGYIEPEAAPLPPDFTVPRTNVREAEESLPSIASSPPVKVERPETPAFRETMPAHLPAPTTAAGAWQFPPVEQSASDPQYHAGPLTRSASRNAFTTPTATPARNHDQSASASMLANAAVQGQTNQPLHSSHVRAAQAPAPAPTPSPRSIQQAASMPESSPVSRESVFPSDPLDDDSVFYDAGYEQEVAATRAILSASPQPIKVLGQFHVHQGSVGGSESSSIFGSIAHVYKDMKGMIDTIELNNHQLKGFIKHHKEPTPKECSCAEEDVENWTLAGTERLSAIRDGLRQSLEAGRIDDVENKMDELSVIHNDVSRLKNRMSNMTKAIEQRGDPERRPLTEDQESLQKQLNGYFASVQQNVRKAEEHMAVLQQLTTIPRGRGPTVLEVEQFIEELSKLLVDRICKIETIGENLKTHGYPASHHDDDHDHDDYDGIATSLNAMTLRSSLGHSSRHSSPAVMATPNKRGYRSRSGTPARAGASLDRRLRTTPGRNGDVREPKLCDTRKKHIVMTALHEITSESGPCVTTFTDNR